jgi:hypothetical protein
MSSYCAACGQRQPSSVAKDCPACGKWAPLFELDDSTFGALWFAAVRVAREAAGIEEFFFNPRVMSGPRPEAAPSWYNPAPPGVLALTMSRPNEEVCLSLVHELGHAVLHPVGSEDDVVAYQQHPVPEERLVHAAADVACRSYGILDYLARMANIGATGCVPIDELGVTERLAAEHLARELVRLLAHYR